MHLYSLLISAFALGLSSGIYCLGYCLPFLAPYMLSEGKLTQRANLFILIEYSLGRLLAYFIFGLVLGWLGLNLKEVISGKIIGLVIILSALLILFYALVKNFPHLRFCLRLESKLSVIKIPFWLGFLAGINICPPFIILSSLAVKEGGIFYSVLIFLSFYLATIIYFIPLIFSGLISRAERIKEAAKIAALLSGIYFLIYGLRLWGQS